MVKLVLNQHHLYIGNLILVNAQHKWHIDYMQSVYLVSQDFPYILLQADMGRLLKHLLGALLNSSKIDLVSGYRSIQEQHVLYEQSVKNNGLVFTQKYVALPQHSEHHTGLALDVALKQSNIDLICPEFPYDNVICDAFRALAKDYGLVERYPKNKESITKIAHEPWHFRYVGSPHANIMEEKQFVLEEYIEFIKAYDETHPFYYQKRSLYCAYLFCPF